MTTPRAIRIDDETWEAALEKTREEGTTVSEIVRAALRRYLGVVLVALALILGLSACGGSAPAATSPTTPTLDQAREQVQAEASAAAEAEVEAKARAAAGLCTDTTRGSEYLSRQDPLVNGSDADRLAAYHDWLDWLTSAPEGCTAKDQQRIADSIRGAHGMIAFFESN